LPFINQEKKMSVVSANIIKKKTIRAPLTTSD